MERNGDLDLVEIVLGYAGKLKPVGGGFDGPALSGGRQGGATG